MLYRSRNDLVLVTIPAAEYVQPVPSCTRGFEAEYMQHKHLQSMLLSPTISLCNTLPVDVCQLSVVT